MNILEFTSLHSVPVGVLETVWQCDKGEYTDNRLFSDMVLAGAIYRYTKNLYGN